MPFIRWVQRGRRTDHIYPGEVKRWLRERVCVCVCVFACAKGQRGVSLFICICLCRSVSVRRWAESRQQRQQWDGWGGRRVCACSSVCVETLSRSQRHTVCVCVCVQERHLLVSVHPLFALEHACLCTNKLMEAYHTTLCDLKTHKQPNAWTVTHTHGNTNTLQLGL